MEEQEKIEKQKDLIAPISEKGEHSPEEFIEWLNHEGDLFKEETAQEVSKLNSVGLDQPTFEEIKNETGIESDLDDVNKGVEVLIAKAKQDAVPINSYTILPEITDYFLNNVSNENRNQDPKFKEAENLLKRIQDTNEEIGETVKKNQENVLQKTIEEEPDFEMKEIIKESSHIEAYTDPVSQPELFFESYTDRVNTVFKDVVARLYPGDSYPERSDRERIREKIEKQIKAIYESKFPGSFSTDTPISEKRNQQDDNQEKTDNVLAEVKEEVNADIRTKEHLSIDTSDFEIASMGSLLTSFPEETREQFEQSVRNYGREYEDLNKDQKFSEIKNSVRNTYDEAMRKLGVPSSEWGGTDRWINWDLAKQAYYFKNPEKTNAHYHVGNPLIDEKVVDDVVQRHVGWEIIQYVQNNPNFIDSLNKKKESYPKIVSFLEQSKEKHNLPSYQLVELGKLLLENKNM